MKIKKADYLTMDLIASRLGCKPDAEKICVAIERLKKKAMLGAPENKASSLYGKRAVSPPRAVSAGRWSKDGSRMRGSR